MSWIRSVVRFCFRYSHQLFFCIVFWESYFLIQHVGTQKSLSENVPRVGIIKPSKQEMDQQTSTALWIPSLQLSAPSGVASPAPLRGGRHSPPWRLRWQPRCGAATSNVPTGKAATTLMLWCGRPRSPRWHKKIFYHRVLTKMVEQKTCHANPKCNRLHPSFADGILWIWCLIWYV